MTDTPDVRCFQKIKLPVPSEDPSLIVNATKEFVNPADRGSLIAQASLLAFVLLWIIELYWVQSSTLILTQVIGPRLAFWAPKIRLALDVLFVSAICITMRIRYLVVIAAITMFGHLVLITYTNCFRRPLSILTVLTTWRDGVNVGRFALSWIPVIAGSLLVTAFLIKIGLLYVARPLRISWRERLITGGLLVLMYGIVFVVTMHFDPLSEILTRRGVGRLGYCRGYLGPWCAELYYLTDPQMTELAIKRVRTKSDQLTPVESPIPIREKLVIIQVESLDYNVLGHRVNGKEVTPFLNQLRQNALFYRARAYHVLGSADADFTVLAGGPPAGNVLNYNLPNFPYDNALPQFLGRFGFKTTSIHGNWGQFYNRRAAFEKMGFAEILFRRNLEERGAFESDAMGLRDRDVLTYSSLSLRKSKGPTCHFIITLTSHTPYQFLKPDECHFIQHSTNRVENYFNHIHYVDSCLRDYVSSLGRDVTVVIYADHPTEEGLGDFQPSRAGTEEFVPVFIYDTDQNLALLQKTRDSMVALDGTLKMTDIFAYLRNQIATQFGGPTSADQRASPAPADAKATSPAGD